MSRSFVRDIVQKDPRSSIKYLQPRISINSPHWVIKKFTLLGYATSSCSLAVTAPRLEPSSSPKSGAPPVRPPLLSPLPHQLSLLHSAATVEAGWSPILSALSSIQLSDCLCLVPCSCAPLVAWLPSKVPMV